MAIKLNRSDLADFLNGENGFFKAVFDKVSCPTIVIDFSANIIDYNEKAANEFGLEDSSLSESLLKQKMVPKEEVSKIAQSIAKERLDIHTGKLHHNLRNTQKSLNTYELLANVIEYKNNSYIILNFELQSPDYRRNYSTPKHQEPLDNKKLNKISKALDFCNEHLKKTGNLTTESLSSLDLSGEEINKMITDINAQYKGMQLTLSKLNILNKLYNNTLIPDFKYYSLQEVVDDILEELNPFIESLKIQINSHIEKNSFAYFDKASVKSLLSNLIFIKLSEGEEKTIDLVSKDNKNNYEIAVTCCKGDFPYSETVDNPDKKYYNELIHSDKGLNKSVWRLLSDSLIDINNGKMLFSDEEENETVHIQLPVTPHNL